MEVFGIAAVSLAVWLGYFLFFKLPGITEGYNKSKVLCEQEKTKQAEAYAAAERDKLERARIENHTYDSYPQ